MTANGEKPQDKVVKAKVGTLSAKPQAISPDPGKLDIEGMLLPVGPVLIVSDPATSRQKRVIVDLKAVRDGRNTSSLFEKVQRGEDVHIDGLMMPFGNVSIIIDFATQSQDYIIIDL